MFAGKETKAEIHRGASCVARGEGGTIPAGNLGRFRVRREKPNGNRAVTCSV